MNLIVFTEKELVVSENEIVILSPMEGAEERFKDFLETASTEELLAYNDWSDQEFRRYEENSRKEEIADFGFPLLKGYL